MTCSDSTTIRWPTFSNVLNSFQPIYMSIFENAGMRGNIHKWCSTSPIILKKGMFVKSSLQHIPTSEKQCKGTGQIVFTLALNIFHVSHPSQQFPRYHHTANNQTSPSQPLPAEDQKCLLSMFSGCSRMNISGGTVSLTMNGAVRRVIVNQGQAAIYPLKMKLFSGTIYLSYWQETRRCCRGLVNAGSHSAPVGNAHND